MDTVNKTQGKIYRVLGELTEMAMKDPAKAEEMIDPIDLCCDELFEAGVFGSKGQNDPRGNQAGSTCWTMRRTEQEDG